MINQSESFAVECRDCQKVIGVYKGEGMVQGICIKCYEELN